MLEIKPKCSEEEFLRTVQKHEMQILVDHGVRRHLRFQIPENTNRWFELVTWADHLCISGDMGTFVFSRIEDMFKFFATAPMQNAEYPINPSYWKEKLLAQDTRSGGAQVFSEDLFKAQIEWCLDECEASADTRLEVEDEIFSVIDEGEYKAMATVMDFKAVNGFTFSDFWEVETKVFTYHYLWCCYAIAWGVRKYADDAAPEKFDNA